jgi:hypothetical protein
MLSVGDSRTPARQTICVRRTGKLSEEAMPQPDAWQFNASQKNEATLKPLCQEIEKHFPPRSRKLCRYFATTDEPQFVTDIGEHYRGLQARREAREGLPFYLYDIFFVPKEDRGKVDGFEDLVAFDDLIYVRHSTCTDPIGCAITYAHELQHLVQFDQSPELLSMNNPVLRMNLYKVLQTPTEIDLPAEVDANIVSKRVAALVCGEAAVTEFAERELKAIIQTGDNTKITRWKFFLETPASASYNWVDETRRMMEKYKDQIDFSLPITAR